MEWDYLLQNDAVLSRTLLPTKLVSLFLHKHPHLDLGSRLPPEELSAPGDFSKSETGDCAMKSLGARRAADHVGGDACLPACCITECFLNVKKDNARNSPSLPRSLKSQVGGEILDIPASNLSELFTCSSP